MLKIFGDKNVQWQTTVEKTRLCNKVMHLGRRTKTHAAEGRVTALLDSLVFAHELQSSYTPCGEIFPLYDTVFNLLTTPERGW